MQSTQARLQVRVWNLGTDLQFFVGPNTLERQIGDDIVRQNRTYMFQIQFQLRSELQEISDQPEEVRGIDL